MAGSAQAAVIPCDRCSGHYVVDAASDGTPRVRCNKCGHVRQTLAPPAPASIPGKWTVIGPDGKAMSFDTWEELTESRRPQAMSGTAKGMEEASSALKTLKNDDKKSASQMLDIAGPKLALAEMDSALDLGEPVGTRAKPRLGATTVASGSQRAGDSKLEPLLVRSFSQTPAKSQTPKLEWAPKIDKSTIPNPRAEVENTMRVETGAKETPSNKAIEPDRETSPSAAAIQAMSNPPDSGEELDPESLLDDEEEPAPLSLRDAIVDADLESGDLQEDNDDPDPHEMLSLRDFVAAPPTGERAVLPDLRSRSSPPPAAHQAKSVGPAPKSVAPPPARPKSLSRPDTGERVGDLMTPSRLPPPTINVEDDKPAEKPPTKSEKPASSRSSTTVRPPARAQLAEAEAPKRTWLWGAVAIVLIGGIAWRLTSNTEEPVKPLPPVTTIAPPTPVTTPAMTATTPPTDDSAMELTAPPTSVTTPSSAVPTVTAPTVSAPIVATGPRPPVDPNGASPPTSAAPKPSSAPVAESGSSMSDLLDRAGAARRKGDFPTARDLYEKVLAMSPNNVEANGGLGDVARAQGDLAAAKASYERALAASPSYSPALLGLADVEWDQGNQGEARKRYAQVVDRMGDRAPARAKERAGTTE
jgi:TolA-binding protein